MILKKDIKERLLSDYKRHAGDTGSPEVQVALLTQRINLLVEHLKKNKKDNHSRRGLIMLVSQRRRLLNYLQGEDVRRFEGLVTKLKLK
jgi:small subunit ribosomal protein S15